MTLVFAFITLLTAHCIATQVNTSSISIQNTIECGESIAGSINENETVYYSLTLPSSISMDTTMTISTCNDETSLDTIIYLYNSTGNKINYNDDTYPFCQSNNFNYWASSLQQQLFANNMYIIAIATITQHSVSNSKTFQIDTQCTSSFIPFTTPQPIPTKLAAPPSYINETDEYYVTSKYPKKSYFGTYLGRTATKVSSINCSPDKHCHVICDGLAACGNRAVINATRAINLTLSCSGVNACESIIVYGAAINNKILCSNAISCQYGTLKLQQEQSSFELHCVEQSCSHFNNYRPTYPISASDVFINCSSKNSCYDA
eukprot:62142_1